MTRLYTCPTCGKITNERYCEDHKLDPNDHRSPNRDRTAQRRFRRIVLARDGQKCVLCGATSKPLVAAHIRPIRDFVFGDPAIYDPENGRTLCEDCDLQTDPFARRQKAVPEKSPERPSVEGVSETPSIEAVYMTPSVKAPSVSDRRLY